jgi:hypothetical protein
MVAVTGSIAFRHQGSFYTLNLPDHGWMAADMVQYVSDIYASADPRIAILKLLGYTLEMNPEAPPRVADHWVEVDLDKRRLATNSELIRKAVRRLKPADDEPYLELSLKNVYEALDRHDFSVELIT